MFVTRLVIVRSLCLLNLDTGARARTPAVGVLVAADYFDLTELEAITRR
jgi:hypothetical protein